MTEFLKGEKHQRKLDEWNLNLLLPHTLSYHSLIDKPPCPQADMLKTRHQRLSYIILPSTSSCHEQKGKLQHRTVLHSKINQNHALTKGVHMGSMLTLTTMKCLERLVDKLRFLFERTSVFLSYHKK